MKSNKIWILVLLTLLVSSFAYADKFNISAIDSLDSSKINKFNATLENSVGLFYYNTTTGTIQLPQYQNSPISGWYLNDSKGCSGQYYQEQTNSFTSGDGVCNLNYSGSYNPVSGTTSGAYDGDFSTKQGSGFTDPFELISEYKIPKGISGAEVRYKWELIGGSTTIVDTTANVPSTCLDNGDNTLYIKSRAVDGSTGYIECFDGTSYININTRSTGDIHFFEEAIIWDFDYNIKDSFGSNNGTLYGKTFYHGTPSGGVTIADGAMNFDGNTQYVEFNSPFETGVKPFTISTWLYYAEATDEVRYFFRDGNGSGNYYFLETRNGKLRFNPSTLGVDLFANVDHPHQEWFLATITYDGTTLTWYQNGASAGSTTGTINHTYTGTYTVSSDVGFNEWNGSITSTQIFNRALNSNEIESIYNAGKDSYSPVGNGLVAQYSGKDYAGTESSPTTIYDTNQLVKGVNSFIPTATYFDGVDDYVYPLNIIDETSTSYSICAWFKPYDTNNEWIINSFDNSPNLLGSIGFKIQGNKVVSQFQGDILEATNVVFINQFIQVCDVYDISNNNHSLFVDGTYRNSEIVSPISGTRDIPFALGGFNNQGTVSGQFNGSIADVRIYDRALTDLEISQLYLNSDVVNVTVEAENYFTTSFDNITFTEDRNFTINPDNAFYLTVRDQKDSAIINQDISVNVQQGTEETVYNITNGQGIIENISANTLYTLVLSTTGYQTRSVTYEHDNTNPLSNLTALLINSSEVGYKDVVFNIVDSSNLPAEDVLVTARALVNGTYQVVQSGETDITGRQTFFLDENIRHQITLEKSGFTTEEFFINAPLDNIYTFRISTLADFDQDNALFNIIYKINPKPAAITNTTYQFNFSVTALDNNLDYFNINVITRNISTGATVNKAFNSSSDSSGGLLSVDVDFSGDLGKLAIFNYCLKKIDQQEVCFYSNIIIEKDYSDERNFGSLKQYIANNLTTGEKVFFFSVFLLITIIISVAIPFTRNIFSLLPIGLSAVFYGWLFLPQNMLIVVGLMTTILIVLLLARIDR